MKISKKILKIVLLLFLSLFFAVFISFVFTFWTGYPGGLDALVHSLKIFWVAKFFPHHNWWNVWASGMPIFLYYPTGPNLLLVLLMKIFDYSPELILSLVAVFSVGFSGFFMGLLVYEYSRKFITSILASFILISTPIVWIFSVSGSYIRIFALPFLIASLYFAGKLAHEPNKKIYQLTTILFLVLGFGTHTLIGGEAIILVGALLVFLVFGFRQKILVLLKTFLPFVLIMSFYFVPLMVFSPRSSFSNMSAPNFDLDNVRFISLKYILGIFTNPAPKFLVFFNLSPFILPLLAFLLLIAFLVKRGIFKQKIFWFYLLGAFIFTLLATTTKIQFLARFYHIVGTQGLLHFAVIFAIAAVGILIGKILGKIANFASLCLIFSLFAFLWFAFSPKPQTWQETIIPKRTEYLEDPVFNSLESPEDSQYRLGTSMESYFAMVFNRFRPGYPQTRDYFANGILNDDFNFYLTKAVWDWGGNLDETEFLLDWWAVDKLLLKKKNEYLDKFADFNLLGETTGMLIYEFGQATPILSSTNTPTVLFIGERENYMVLFHALAQANINSQKIIPVYLGKNNLRGLKLSELKKFSAVFAYDAELEDKRGQTALKSYVEEGGTLFIESRGEGFDLSEPFPIKGMGKDRVEEKWDLVEQNYDFGISLEDFSPPIFEEGPWGVSTAKDLYPWAQVLVSESGEPIIVGGKLGEGKVVWSGMNLLYHTVNYKNKEEALLIKGIFDWLQDGKKISETDFEVEFVHPEKRIVDLKSETSGVLFKEVDFPKWHAYLESGNKKQEVKIYKAGPDFMYVPLSDIKVDERVVFKYKVSIIEIIAYIISLLTFAGLILWFFDWWIFKSRMEALMRKITSPKKKLLEWWKSEEE